MKKIKAAIILGVLLMPALAKAFPPAPHHTFFGMVRDEFGRPLQGSKVEILFETSPGKIVRTKVNGGILPGTNYELLVPMDSGSTPDLYKASAMRHAMPYKIQVRVGSQVFLPIEMIGKLNQIGKPGEKTHLDLTLGEDSDGDGLPDAWERALLANGKKLSDINPEDDADGDGLSNLDEYISGNYAFDREDGLKLDILNQTGEETVLEFLGISGRTYTIMGSNDLKDWREMPFFVEGEEGEFENVRVNKVGKYRVAVPSDGQRDFKAKFFKLMVQ